MSKRNIISEIQEKNARSSGRFLHGKLELFDLEASFQKLDPSNATMRALHMMGIASCIEVSVREAIKRLVDSGEPYIERASAFGESIKFDHAMTRALSTGKISFGDLISHSLPVSKIEHISNQFEVLFNDAKSKTKRNFSKLLSEVRQYAEPGDDELFGDGVETPAQSTAPFLLKEASEVQRDIAATFELRHLVAHEANFSVVSPAELAKYLNSARLFVDALYEMVEQALNPGASRNGFGGSIQHSLKAEEQRSSAKLIRERISSKLESMSSPGRRDLVVLFDAAQDAFDALAAAESDLRLELHGPANGNAMRNIESRVTIQLWRQRQEYLADVEDDVNFYASLA